MRSPSPGVASRPPAPAGTGAREPFAGVPGTRGSPAGHGGAWPWHAPFLVARKQLSGLKASAPTPIFGFALSAAGFRVCRDTGASAISSAVRTGRPRTAAAQHSPAHPRPRSACGPSPVQTEGLAPGPCKHEGDTARNQG